MANLRRREFLKLGGMGLAMAVASLMGGVQSAESAPESLSNAAPEEHRTPVTWVRALVNVNVRTGPSTAYRRIGLLWAGHRVRVLARSTNWRWWCIRWGRRTAWVSADPHLTRPLHW
jgi:uncharacterized protein YgiM (DUF1202 family)